MFNGCKLLSNLNISSFDTKNVTNMDYIFFDCWLLNISDISFSNIRNVVNKNNIYINRWDINKPKSDNKNMENEIFILIEVNKEDINKKINILNE